MFEPNPCDYTDDASDAFVGAVVDDEAWMAKAAARLLFEQHEDGELAICAYDGAQGLRRLRAGLPLDSALQGLSAQSASATTKLLDRLIALADALHSAVASEAIDRAELARREDEATRGY